jgi:hypothetical protein
MRILVIMSDNRKLERDMDKADYNSLVASINYEYCKAHNYDFLYYRPYLNIDSYDIHNCIDPNTNTARHAAWSKLLSVRLALHLDYEYVVYIDSDCIFKNFKQTLEEYIQPNMHNNFIFFNNKPWDVKKPCSGFFISKVCPTTIQYIRDWYTYNFKDNKNPCRWEQGALWFLYTTFNCAIRNEWMFCEKKRQFLRHVGSFESNIRIPYFQNFITSNKINHQQNIQKMQYIEYDTITVIL